MDNAMASDDPFDLTRFLAAQDAIYFEALAELRNGKKQTHWMWFIFPQIEGLGTSPMAKRYAIRSREEARQYVLHPILGQRLRECTDALLALDEKPIDAILGFPDDLKLKSSMTLFASLADPGSLFHRVLNRYFCGEQDSKTIERLAHINKQIGDISISE
jgi:uncharacterized protein (DUF1810 family)